MFAISLFAGVAVALGEHGSARLVSTVTFAVLAESWPAGHRDLRSRGITDCPMTTATVTRVVADGILPTRAIRLMIGNLAGWMTA